MSWWETADEDASAVIDSAQAADANWWDDPEGEVGFRTLLHPTRGRGCYLVLLGVHSALLLALTPLQHCVCHAHSTCVCVLVPCTQHLCARVVVVVCACVCVCWAGEGSMRDFTACHICGMMPCLPRTPTGAHSAMHFLAAQRYRPMNLLVPCWCPCTGCGI